jgi:hypothetical protein
MSAADFRFALELINDWCEHAAAEREVSPRLMALQQIGVIARDALAKFGPEPIPTGEAQDSDFGTFISEGGQP